MATYQNAALEGKVAIVTGGGSGIGRATAELFAARGVHVVVADFDAGAADKVAAAVRCAHGNLAHGETASVGVDVSSPHQVEQMVETAIALYGRVDILFNGAGILAFGTAVETELETWNRVLAVNLTGTFLCSRAVLRPMIAQQGGVIINVASSTGAHDAAANTVAYVASKGGVTLLTKAMAVDHAQHNIRVNAIAPGPTDTPMLRGNFTPDALAAFARTFPMQRLASPDEVAKAALFLASDDASFVTGAILAVDGGQTAAV